MSGRLRIRAPALLARAAQVIAACCGGGKELPSLSVSPVLLNTSPARPLAHVFILLSTPAHSQKLLCSACLRTLVQFGARVLEGDDAREGTPTLQRPLRLLFVKPRGWCIGHRDGGARAA